MGDISIIARRLADGHVQHGWSGNGGYYAFVGERLLQWYSEPEDVEYLFGLGQTSCIGRKGSENGGYSIFETHELTGQPFWLADTERSIFTKICWIDYGYFYDLDNKWYYVVPGPFRIKIPLELVRKNLNKQGYEFEYRRKIEDNILRYIFNEYKSTHSKFDEFIKRGGYDLEKVYKDIEYNGGLSMYKLFDKYHNIFDYFDDWVLIKADDKCENISEIIVRKEEEKHIETCEW